MNSNKIILIVFLIILALPGVFGYDYWRNDENVSNVWVKVNLTFGTNLTLQIINSSGTYPENITKVMIFGDDFNDGSVDLSVWNYTHAGVFSETGGSLVYAAPTSRRFYALNSQDISGGVIYEIYIEYSNSQTPSFSLANNTNKYCGDSGMWGVCFAKYGQNQLYDEYANGVQDREWIDGTYWTTAEQSHIVWDFVINSSGAMWQKFNGDGKINNMPYNDSYIDTWEDFKTQSHITISSVSSGSPPTNISYVFIRKYAVTEPNVITSCVGGTCTITIEPAANENEYQILIQDISLGGDLNISELDIPDPPIISQDQFSNNITVTGNNATQTYNGSANDLDGDNMTCQFYWNNTLIYEVNITDGGTFMRSQTMPAISDPISQYWNCTDGNLSDQTPEYFVFYQFTNVSIGSIPNITTTWTTLINQSVLITEIDNQTITCYLNDTSLAYAETNGVDECYIIGNYTQADIGIHILIMNVTDGDSWDIQTFTLNITNSSEAGGTCQIYGINTFSNYNLGYTASISANVRDDTINPLVFASCQVTFYNNAGDPIITEPYLNYVKSTYGGTVTFQYDFQNQIFEENEILIADIYCFCLADNTDFKCYNELTESTVGFYSCHSQTNVTLGSDQRQPEQERFVGLIIALIFITFVFGYLGHNSEIQGIKMFGYGIALIQTLLIGFIIYNNELRKNFISILKIELIVLLLLGFLMLMVAGYNFIIKLVNPDPDSPDLLEDKKWGK